MDPPGPEEAARLDHGLAQDPAHENRCDSARDAARRAEEVSDAEEIGRHP